MRTPIVILAGSLLLAACGPSPNVVYQPAPVPAPEPLPPVGITVVRSDRSKLLVSTNQPAYLAVFEIVPYRGVSLIYPTSPRQREFEMSGFNWLPVFWRSQRQGYESDRYARNDSYDPYVPDAGEARYRSNVHYIYAIASDRPLRLTEDAFDDDYLRDLIGYRAFHASDPYETMHALSRQFVEPEMDQDWGEDVYTMDVSRPLITIHLAKVFCPGGYVFEVNDDLVDRAWCPVRRGRETGSYREPAPRPDSVVAYGPHGLGKHYDPPAPARPPIFRVPAPNDVHGNAGMGGAVLAGRPGDAHGGGVAGGGPVITGGGDDHPDGGQQGDDHHDNGHHYGWTKGNGGQGNDGNGRGRGMSGQPGNGNGQGTANGNGNGNGNGNNAYGHGLSGHGDNGGHGNVGNQGNGNTGYDNADHGNAGHGNAGHGNAGHGNAGNGNAGNGGSGVSSGNNGQNAGNDGHGNGGDGNDGRGNGAQNGNAGHDVGNGGSGQHRITPMPPAARPETTGHAMPTDDGHSMWRRIEQPRGQAQSPAPRPTPVVPSQNPRPDTGARQQPPRRVDVRRAPPDSSDTAVRRPHP